MTINFRYERCDHNICYPVFNFYLTIIDLNICLRSVNIFSSHITDSNRSSTTCCRFKRDVFLQGGGYEKECTKDGS
jgi:hypothetical protein